MRRTLYGTFLVLTLAASLVVVGEMWSRPAPKPRPPKTAHFESANRNEFSCSDNTPELRLEFFEIKNNLIEHKNMRNPNLTEFAYVLCQGEDFQERLWEIRFTTDEGDRPFLVNGASRKELDYHDISSNAIPLRTEAIKCQRFPNC